ETGATSGSANYLNAPSLAEDRGITVTESRPVEECEFTDLITVTVSNGDESTSISGTFFGSQARIVKIQEHNIDATPEGHLLVFENTDAPGIVGAIGRVLGESNINIANMSLSRNQVGGLALSILNIDSAATPEVIENILAIEGIKVATSLEL
ncbi:MAG: ACT domain-containing protein, partial [Verrucomicrobiales bacterium]|nr:ACT domain-containing protein [Verrucomicrobiales bacterium]